MFKKQYILNLTKKGPLLFTFHQQRQPKQQPTPEKAKSSFLNGFKLYYKQKFAKEQKNKKQPINLSFKDANTLFQEQKFKKKQQKKEQLQYILQYQPSFFLHSPFAQVVCNVIQPKLSHNVFREKIFFDDGGHISLDWSYPKQTATGTPILFIMHGLTGGSEENYILALMKEANSVGYISVCHNSRGINNEMTSPIPFTAVSFHELECSLECVETNYPNSPIFLLGTSFGGNYLMRFLMNHKRKSVAGLVVLAPPINIATVIDNMGPTYQWFFTRRHKEMLFWEKIGVVNKNQIKKAKNLREYHRSVTTQILGLQNQDELFNYYLIKPEDIRKIDTPTYLLLAEDDPVVSFNSMPIDSFISNPNICLEVTKQGGHLCWFQGFLPKRWYPRRVMQYLEQRRFL